MDERIFPVSLFSITKKPLFVIKKIFFLSIIGVEIVLTLVSQLILPLFIFIEIGFVWNTGANFLKLFLDKEANKVLF